MAATRTDPTIVGSLQIVTALVSPSEIRALGRDELRKA